MSTNQRERLRNFRLQPSVYAVLLHMDQPSERYFQYTILWKRMTGICQKHRNRIRYFVHR